MALTKRCLDCGTRTVGSRCARCMRRRDDSSTRRKIRSGWDWRDLRAQVHKRDRVCVSCGSSKALQVRHRIRLARGGTNRLDNLELRCSRCHTAAHRNLENEKSPRSRAGSSLQRCRTS